MPCSELDKWQGGTQLDASRPTHSVSYRWLSTGGGVTFVTNR
jgi:hypothetical protein